MQLLYTGDFDKLEELDFQINYYDWYVYRDRSTRCEVIVKPLTKEILLEYWEPDVISTSERESINYKRLPEVLYILIQLGLTKKGGK